MIMIREARYQDGYRIWLKFDTGEEGVADLADLIRQFPIAKPLRDKEQFKAFYLDNWPTVAWPCGFDVSPESLYERATGKQVAWLHT